MGFTGIPWECEVLLQFRGNWNEYGNGSVGIWGNKNITFFHFPLKARK